MSENNTPSKALDVSVRIYPLKEQSSLLAFANVTIGGCFAVNNIRVMDGKNGPFMAMPSGKDRDGKYHDTCFPTTKEMRDVLNNAVMNEFQQVMQMPEAARADMYKETKPSVRAALKSAAKSAASVQRPAPQRTEGTR